MEYNNTSWCLAWSGHCEGLLRQLLSIVLSFVRMQINKQVSLPSWRMLNHSLKFIDVQGNAEFIAELLYWHSLCATAKQNMHVAQSRCCCLHFNHSVLFPVQYTSWVHLSSSCCTTLLYSVVHYVLYLFIILLLSRKRLQHWPLRCCHFRW